MVCVLVADQVGEQHSGLQCRNCTTSELFYAKCIGIKLEGRKIGGHNVPTRHSRCIRVER